MNSVNGFCTITALVSEHTLSQFNLGGCLRISLGGASHYNNHFSCHWVPIASE